MQDKPGLNQRSLGSEGAQICGTELSQEARVRVHGGEVLLGNSTGTLYRVSKYCTQGR